MPKDSPKSQVRFEVLREYKTAWVRAAQRAQMNLVTWITTTLNAQAERELSDDSDKDEKPEK